MGRGKRRSPGGWWTVRVPEGGRAGCLGGSEWGSRVLGKLGEILGTAFWLRESGPPGVSMQPLLHPGPGFGLSFWEGLPLVQCQPLDWNHLEDGARKSHPGPCMAVGGLTGPLSAGCRGQGCSVVDPEHLGRCWVSPKFREIWQGQHALRDERGSPARHPWVPTQA